MFQRKSMFFSPKQGLARFKAFFKLPNDSVHNELHTYPPSLTAALRGCVREKYKL